MLRSPVDALSSTLLPASCFLCGSPLPRLSYAPICSVCWTEFPVAGDSACLRCGDSLIAPGSLPASGLCRACRLAPPPFERAASAGLYQGRMRDAIHALKYSRLYPAAKPLGHMLARAIAQLGQAAPDLPAAPREMLVIPVPLHRSKHAQRGFNQARLLVQHALSLLRKTHPGWQFTLAPGTLMRLRATQSQAGLTPRQRRLNLRGAFSVSNPAAVAGRHVLVVDDIMTTGATARAAARALLRAGAESVWVATLARARRVNFSTSSASFEDAEDLNPQTGSAPFAPMQGARSYPQDSSEGQMSF